VRHRRNALLAVAAIDTQTGLLFDVGGGYANPDQLRAALWADLEALGG